MALQVEQSQGYVFKNSVAGTYLNCVGGFKDKGRHYCEGGDAGDREELINELVTRMV